MAEIALRVNGNELVMTQEHAEAGAAIELAADRLEEQLRRLKDRRLTGRYAWSNPQFVKASRAHPL